MGTYYKPRNRYITNEDCKKAIAHLRNDDGKDMGKYYKEDYMAHYAQNKYADGYDNGWASGVVSASVIMLLGVGISCAADRIVYHFEHRNEDE